MSDLIWRNVEEMRSVWYGFATVITHGLIFSAEGKVCCCVMISSENLFTPVAATNPWGIRKWTRMLMLLPKPCFVEVATTETVFVFETLIVLRDQSKPQTAIQILPDPKSLKMPMIIKCSGKCAGFLFCYKCLLKFPDFNNIY